MIEIRINSTSLCDGHNSLTVERFADEAVAKDWIEYYLGTLDVELPRKFVNAQRRFRKGTSKGIKIFYSPRKGVRVYLWITILKEIILL